MKISFIILSFIFFLFSYKASVQSQKRIEITKNQYIQIYSFCNVDFNLVASFIKINYNLILYPQLKCLSFLNFHQNFEFIFSF